MFDSLDSLWVFGYGSLIWNPGFNHTLSVRAYADGYARRMYQGNAYHRGNEQVPGRVATIVRDANEFTNGMVFRIDGVAAIKKAVAHLVEREIENGYEFRWIPVTLVDTSDSRIANVIALTCTAKLDYEFYLGEDSTVKMAAEICEARGCAGPNSDYVLKLAENVRKLFPRDEDEHLYQLEHHIKQGLQIAA